MARGRRSLAIALSLLMFATGVPDSAASPSADPDPSLLPDLTMARVGDLRLIRAKNGGLQLRFSSTVINAGSGPMVVRATRKKAKDEFVVTQRVHTLDGRRPFLTIPVGTVFAGDGHTHWHIRDVVRYTLTPLDPDNATKSRRVRKVGFCLYDNERRAPRPGQPTRPDFPRQGCGEHDSKVLQMGLSVGWGDKYTWTLLGQYVNMTGLPVGDYRLLGTANPNEAFFEQRSDNNTVFTDIRLRREKGKASIRILDRGGRPPGEPDTAELRSGASQPGGVDYATWPSTPAPLTQSSRTRSRKEPSRA